MSEVMNYFQNIEFKLTVERLPHVSFTVQAINVPGMSSGTTTQPTPFKNIYLHGDKPEYNDLNATVVVTDGLANFIEIQKWIVGLTKPKEFKQYKELLESDYGLYSDLNLTLLNAQKNPILHFQFHDAFPISLSDISLDTRNETIDIPTFDVTFKYNGYDIINKS